MKGDSEKDVLYETNVLGEESFKVFYPSAGFIVLNRLINKKSEILKTIKIYDEQKKSYTLTEFVDELAQWKIKKST
jgi:hypothetical protein